MAEELPDSQLATEPATPRPARARKSAADRVRIVVHQDGTPGAEKEIFVGVNGVGYRIKRGVEVEVPRAVVRVLEESVKTVYEQVRNEDGSVSMIARDLPTYPFQVKG